MLTIHVNIEYNTGLILGRIMICLQDHAPDHVVAQTDQ